MKTRWSFIVQNYSLAQEVHQLRNRIDKWGIVTTVTGGEWWFMLGCLVGWKLLVWMNGWGQSLSWLRWRRGGGGFERSGVRLMTADWQHRDGESLLSFSVQLAPLCSSAQIPPWISTSTTFRCSCHLPISRPPSTNHIPPSFSNSAGSWSAGTLILGFCLSLLKPFTGFLLHTSLNSFISPHPPTSSSSIPLTVPSVCLSTVGPRAFSLLPAHIWNIDSHPALKSCLPGHSTHSIHPRVFWKALLNHKYY